MQNWSAFVCARVSERVCHKRNAFSVSFTLTLDGPVRALEFDHRCKGLMGRLPIELSDGNKSIIWSWNTGNGCEQHVRLAGLNVTDKLTFTVRKNAYIIYPGWTHEISNLRVEGTRERGE